MSRDFKVVNRFLHHAEVHNRKVEEAFCWREHERSRATCSTVASRRRSHREGHELAEAVDDRDASEANRRLKARLEAATDSAWGHDSFELMYHTEQPVVQMGPTPVVTKSPSTSAKASKRKKDKVREKEKEKDKRKSKKRKKKKRRRKEKDDAGNESNSQTEEDVDWVEAPSQ